MKSPGLSGALHFSQAVSTSQRVPLAPFDTVPNATPRLRFAATNPGNPGQGEGNFGTPSVYLLRLLTRCDRIRPRRNCTLHVAARNIARRRLNESLKILDAPARAKPCKGMAGLIEDGEEVISEGSPSRPRIDWRGTTCRALRNRGLYDGAQPRPAASPAGDRSAPDHVIERRAKRRPVARSGGATFDVRGEDARQCRIAEDHEDCRYRNSEAGKRAFRTVPQAE